MFGNIDSQCGFAHRGARRQDDQVTGLKARRHAVQVIKTGGHARHVIGVIGHLLDPVHEADDQGVHGLEALAIALALLANIENLLLCLVHDVRDRAALGVKRIGGDFVAGRYQFAQDGSFAHDLGVAADIAGAGHILRQRVEVDQAAHLVAVPLALQVLKHRNDIGRPVGIYQCADGREHETVLVTVKIAF